MVFIIILGFYDDEDYYMACLQEDIIIRSIIKEEVDFLVEWEFPNGHGPC